MKNIFAAVIALGLLYLQSANAEQWGAWSMGSEVDTMTEKKTTFVHGEGHGIVMEVICEISKYKETAGKRSLDVAFKVSDYLGSGPGRPPDAIFRLDQRPALRVQLAGYYKDVVTLFDGTVFVEKLLERPAMQLRVRFTARDHEKRYEYNLQLEGMKEAIKELKKDCGMTPQNTWRAPPDWEASIRSVE